jgi:hypothetical protein
MKNITIVTIDSLHYNTTAWVIDRTRKFFPDAQVLTLGNKPYYTDSVFVKTDKFNHQGHSELCLHAVAPHVTTDMALFVQWDGIPVDHTLWDPKWLNIDYIGAPWSYDKLAVGNGGLSLRSKRLLDHVAARYPEYSYAKHGPEDQWICRFLRPELEEQGLKWGTVKQADKFSIEHPVHATPQVWGFHGEWHAKHYLREDFAQWRRLHLDDLQLGKI